MTQLQIIGGAISSAVIACIIWLWYKGQLTWKRLLPEIALSVLVGGIVGSLLSHFTEWPPMVVCSICASLGTMGVHVIEALQNTFKIGVSVFQSQIKSKGEGK